MATPDPCRTLYVRNIPERTSKQRLRKLLHAAFSPYGRITYIVAEKTLKLRGQAFITYETLASATAALRKMHATQFMGKQITVAYSKQVSGVAKYKNAGENLSNGKELKGGEKGASLDTTQGTEVGNITGHKPEEINRILFVESLPKGSVDKLQELFARFSGFVEVRGVPGKADIAFVEYATDAQAAVALGGLRGHMIGDPPKPLTLSFAKK